MVSGNANGNSWASDEDYLYPPFQDLNLFLPYFINGDIEGFSMYNDLMVAGIYRNLVNTFYGIDMVSKDTVWVFPVPSSSGSIGLFSAQDDDIVIVGGQGCDSLICLNRSSGSVKWVKPMSSAPYYQNPVIDGENVYISNDTLYCLNASNGYTIWTYEIQGQTTPVLDDNNCYITAQNQTVALDKANGDFLWSRYNSNFHFCSVAVDGFYVYTTSNDSIIARNKSDGNIEWAYQMPVVDFPEFLTKNIAVDDSVVAVTIYENTDGFAQVFVFDKRTGAIFGTTPLQVRGLNHRQWPMGSYML
jgi:outer membrane protein assembly factor BamB